jgi:hypothetical protein
MTAVRSGCGWVWWCCVWGWSVVQVPLMGVLNSAVAAVDAHRGIAGVAELGVFFLRSLAWADANKVRVVAVDKEDGPILYEWHD